MERLRNMSLRRSFFLLALCGLVIALVLALAVWCGCAAIARQYPSGGYVIGPGGTVTLLPFPTEEERWLLELLGVLPVAGCLLFPVLGLGAAAALFYRWKLREPIDLLAEGTRRIREQDLDFTIPAISGDELGQLCAAFETMRRQLLRTNRELWHQAEERKRLNAAFAHDLRNPVTVLKGSVKMLRQGARDGETIDRLERYTLRIEEYIEAMSGIQRLEQLPVRPAAVTGDALREELDETARVLAPALGVTISGELPERVTLDRGIFLTVAENLIGNAARFAREKVTLTLTPSGEALTLTVADDGPGFPAELLKSGPRPFGRMGEEPEHFGMGLYGSGLLCRKHGGELRLANAPAGGAVVTAVFGAPAVP